MNLEQLNKLKYHLRMCAEIVEHAENEPDRLAQIIREELRRVVHTDEAYTLKEVSKITKLSSATLNRYKDIGKLRVKKVEGSKTIVLKEDLINFLKELK